MRIHNPATTIHRSMKRSGSGKWILAAAVAAVAFFALRKAQAAPGGGGGSGGTQTPGTGGVKLAFATGQLYSLQITSPTFITASQVQHQLESEGFNFTGDPATAVPQPSGDPSYQWDAIGRFSSTAGNYPADIGLGITVITVNAIPG